MARRQTPNVLVCGTPGTGKSSLCAKVRLLLPDYQYIDISDFCRTNDCIECRDEELDTDVIDEDLMCEKLGPVVADGGYLIDYHSADLFPKDMIDVIFVLRCNNTVLYDRLKARAYSEPKLTNNIECEIFNTIAEEAIEAFGPGSVQQLDNETNEELVANCLTIVDWIKRFPDD